MKQSGRGFCPLSRKFWKHKREDLVTLDKDLYIDAVQLYPDWLYTRNLLIPEELDREEENFTLFILKAFDVTDIIKDDEFRRALVAKFTFRDELSTEMQEFAVDAFLMDIYLDWFVAASDTFPREFVQAVLLAALKEMLKKHAGKDCMVEDSVDEDENEAESERIG